MTEMPGLAHTDENLCEACGCEVVVVSEQGATFAWLECDCGRAEILLWDPAGPLSTAA